MYHKCYSIYKYLVISAKKYKVQENLTGVAILGHIIYNPNSSSGKVGLECRISESRGRQILKEHKHHD